MFLLRNWHLTWALGDISGLLHSRPYFCCIGNSLGQNILDFA